MSDNEISYRWAPDKYSSSCKAGVLGGAVAGVSSGNPIGFIGSIIGGAIAGQCNKH